ncbi:MAG: TetR/AcrR family transcriptional regulator [Cytophagales bacterium]
MSTKEILISAADDLIRSKGYNAFSFKDLSVQVGIKTASIHYYFPTKTDLGVAIVQEHLRRFVVFEKNVATLNSLQKIECFLEIYQDIKNEHKICIVGSLATDFYTVEEPIKQELKIFTDTVLLWLTHVLEHGRDMGEIYLKTNPRTQALLLITNVLAVVQLSRLTSDEDFRIVKEAILDELKINKS